HTDSGFAYATASGEIVFVNATFPSLPIPSLSQLPVNRLIYDGARQRIYASIPGRGGALGNTVAMINPATAAIVASIPIGSEPGILALSSDSTYLYVALQGAALVKRINLNTQQVDLQFGLGFDQNFGPKFAQDLSVMPGDPNTVAIAKMYTTI